MLTPPVPFELAELGVRTVCLRLEPRLGRWKRLLTGPTYIDLAVNSGLVFGSKVSAPDLLVRDRSNSS